MKWLERISGIVAAYFPLWVIVGAAVAFFWPGTFLFVLPHMKPLLGVVMFGMGMTLSLEDFKRVLTRPRQVLVGVCAQYVAMPLLALALARLLGLPPELAVGMVLLGACPGGTASNVITFLARGDVALSVTLTSVSTILSPILTPCLTLWLAGQWMAVPVDELFKSIVQIILLPVTLGVLVHWFLPKTVERSTRVLPLISVVTIVLLVGAVVGKNAEGLFSSGGAVLVGVVAHNSLGLLLGFAAAAALGMRKAQRRAVAIEVGMQNSGLAVTLAMAHISPAAAIPGAIFSVWHNTSGPLLATWWNRSDRRQRRLGQE